MDSKPLYIGHSIDGLPLTEDQQKRFVRITPNQMIVFIRNPLNTGYKQQIEQKLSDVEKELGEIPGFRMPDISEMRVITTPIPDGIISRVQGFFYRPQEGTEETGVLYVNTGRNPPRFSSDREDFTGDDQVTLNQRLYGHKKVRLTGNKDALLFSSDNDLIRFHRIGLYE